jgi:hypothetical protein
MAVLVSGPRHRARIVMAVFAGGRCDGRGRRGIFLRRGNGPAGGEEIGFRGSRLLGQKRWKDTGKFTYLLPHSYTRAGKSGPLKGLAAR